MRQLWAAAQGDRHDWDHNGVPVQLRCANHGAGGEMSALGTAVSIFGAAIEAVRVGIEVYRATRKDDIVRAPRHIKEAAHAEAERRKRAKQK